MFLNETNYFYAVTNWKNIFVLPLMVAWLIIFAHDAIPHHHESFTHNCTEHSVPHETLNIDTNTRIEKEMHHEHCTFSVDILPEVSVDHFFYNPVQRIRVSPIVQKFQKLYTYRNLLLEDSVSLYLNLLRAPPRIS